MGRLKANLLKYGIGACVCGTMVWFYISQRDFANQSLMEQYRILCDAFTIPGLVAIMLGFLLAISNDGLFLGLTYSLNMAIRALIPGGRWRIQKYADYVAERKGKKVTGFGFLFVLGGICMAAALVFMILFYRLYG